MSPYSETGLLHMEYTKMRSHWIMVGPHPMIVVLIRKGKFGHRLKVTHMGECHVRIEEEISMLCLQAKKH